MKHLKIYEDYNKVEDIKKYFISEVIDALGIFELLNIKKRDIAEIKILHIYVKNEGSDKIKEFRGGIESYDKPIAVIKNKIFFQSDSLEECKDMIPYIYDINKFNL